MSSSHYFIGIPVPAKVQEELEKTQQQLQLEKYYKKIPYKEDFHITILFLGDWQNRGRLWNELKERVQKVTPFQLTLDQLGFFGNPATPRVFWAGVKQEDSLFDLEYDVKNAALNLGFKLENRPYRPHITLGKVLKTSHNKTFPKMELELPQITWEVSELRLYRVNLGQRPMYETFSKITFSR